MYLEDSKTLGEELEREFTNKAKQGGLTEDETRSAFNRNVRVLCFGKEMLKRQMIPTGMAAKDLAQFTKERGGGRKWLIGDFQAGDAVFHHSCKGCLASEAEIDIRYDSRWRCESGSGE